MSIREDISAVITSYNQKGMVTEALNSVLSQTRKPKSIIIVDDGSSDYDSINELKVIEKSIYDVNVSVIRGQNKGVSAARNQGIAASDTEYVLILDGDDRIENSFIEKTFDLLKTNESMIAASSWMHCFGVLDAEVRPDGGDIKSFLSHNGCPATNLLRVRAWSMCGGYDENMRSGFEDWDFFLSMLEKNPSSYIGIVEEALIEYRTAPLSSNVKSMDNRIELIRGLIKKHRKVYETYVEDALLGIEKISISRLLGWESELKIGTSHSGVSDDFLKHPSYGDGGMAAAVRIASKNPVFSGSSFL